MRTAMSLVAVAPAALSVLLTPMLLRQQLPDLTAGAVIGGLLGLSLTGLIVLARHARHMPH